MSSYQTTVVTMPRLGFALACRSRDGGATLAFRESFKDPNRKAVDIDLPRDPAIIREALQSLNTMSRQLQAILHQIETVEILKETA